MKSVRVVLAVMLIAAFASPAVADQAEQQIGMQVRADLAKKNELILSSPYYGILNPIAARIKRVADPQYDAPFHFTLVHEAQPNAFAVPGGGVYVTDSLMKFATSTEMLAGVLCHETSHTIHHDVMRNINRDRNVAFGAAALSLLLGGGKNNYVNEAANLGSGALVMQFSRQVETAADLKGSDTCAAAGYNPNGMIWLFRKFETTNQGASMEMLSDHPTDGHRIADLQTHFAQNPARFAHFSSNPATATPLHGEGTSTTPL